MRAVTAIAPPRRACQGFLTVPYLQLPLVLDFFASQDRATYLFNLEQRGSRGKFQGWYPDLLTTLRQEAIDAIARVVADKPGINLYNWIPRAASFLINASNVWALRRSTFSLHTSIHLVPIPVPLAFVHFVVVVPPLLLWGRFGRCRCWFWL